MTVKTAGTKIRLSTVDAMSPTDDRDRHRRLEGAIVPCARDEGSTPAYIATVVVTIGRARPCDPNRSERGVVDEEDCVFRDDPISIRKPMINGTLIELSDSSGASSAAQHRTTSTRRLPATIVIAKLENTARISGRAWLGSDFLQLCRRHRRKGLDPHAIDLGIDQYLFAGHERDSLVISRRVTVVTVVEIGRSDTTMRCGAIGRLALPIVEGNHLIEEKSNALETIAVAR